MAVVQLFEGLPSNDRIVRMREIARWVGKQLDRAVENGADAAVAAGLYNPLCLALLNMGEPRPKRWKEELRRVAFLGKRVLCLASSKPAAASPSRSIFALVLPRLANHLADLAPLGHELIRRGHSVVMASRSLFPELSRLGFAPDLLEDTAPWETVRELLAESVSGLMNHVRLEPLGNTSSSAVQAVFIRTALECLPQIVSYRRAIRDRLKRVRPALAVIGNPNAMEGAVAAVEARRAGISSIALQHGTVLRDDPAWWRCPADHVLAWGEDGRRNLISSGVGVEAVHTVGCLRLDSIEAAEGRRGDEVLVASSGAGHQVGIDEQRAFISTVYEAASRTPALRWKIKLHPKDDIALYRREAARWPASISLVTAVPNHKGTDIFEHLSSAGVLVTIASTAALDAIAVRVPVVAVQRERRCRKADHSFLSAATVAVGVGELVAAVERSMAQRTRAPDDGRQFHANRGRATAAAATACEVLSRPMDSLPPGLGDDSAGSLQNG